VESECFEWFFVIQSSDFVELGRLYQCLRANATFLVETRPFSEFHRTCTRGSLEGADTGPIEGSVRTTSMIRFTE
jgi:hypothetical protein